MSVKREAARNLTLFCPGAATLSRNLGVSARNMGMESPEWEPSLIGSLHSTLQSWSRFGHFFWLIFCPFDGPYLLTNPVPWVETRKSVYHQIHSPYPWISKFRAKNRNFWGDLQVPAWVPDTPASRSDLSALYTTLSRLDQVQNQTPSIPIGDGFTKKVAVLLDFVQITSLPPIWATCSTLFERQKRWFKRHSKWLII